MRSFALVLVLLTVIGFTTSFVRTFVPSVRRSNAFVEIKQQWRANEVQRNQIPTLYSQVSRNAMFLRNSESETEVDMLDDVEFTKGMPDKTEFTLFYRKTVPFGSEMTLQQVRHSISYRINFNHIRICL